MILPKIGETMRWLSLLVATGELSWPGQHRSIWVTLHAWGTGHCCSPAQSDSTIPQAHCLQMCVRMWVVMAGKMFDSDYFYSSAPSDISSDITIHLPDHADDDVSIEPCPDHGHDRHHRHAAVHSQSSSLSDKIARKLFRKKRKEMLGGNYDRWETWSTLKNANFCMLWFDTTFCVKRRKNCKSTQQF